MSAEWYYHDGTTVHGPLSPRQLAELAARGSLRPDHRVKKGSDGKWHVASQVKGLTFASAGQPQPVIEAAIASPPPLPVHHTPTAPSIAEPVTDQSSRSVTVIQPVAIYRAPYTGFAGHAVQHYRRLIRPPMRPYLIAAACGLALIAIVAVGLMVGHSSRPGDQTSPSQSAGGDKPDDTFRQGEIAYEKQDYDLAISCFTEAIRLRPNYAKGYCNRGNAYWGKGDQDRAIADVTEAIRLKPDYAEAYHSRGVEYWFIGNQDRAIADFTEAIRLRPDYALAYYCRGIAYAKSVGPNKGIADFNEAIRLKPAYADAYCGRGSVYLDSGDIEKAIGDLTEAIRLNPNDALAHFTRGNAYKSRGDQNSADMDYAEAKRLGYVGNPAAPQAQVAAEQPTPLANETGNRTLAYWKRIRAILAAGPSKQDASRPPSTGEVVAGLENLAKQITDEPTLAVDLEAVRCAYEYSNFMINLAGKLRNNSDPGKLIADFAKGYARGQQGDLTSGIIEARQEQDEMRQHVENLRKVCTETRAAMTAKYGVEFPSWGF